MTERSATQRAATLSTDQRIATLEKLAAGQPSNNHRKIELAFAYLQKVRETTDYAFLDRASALADAVLNADSGNFEALRLQNEIGMQRHEFRDVAARAESLSKVVSNDAGNLGNFGDALMELGEYDRAGAVYQRMLASRPGLESYNRFAYYKFVTGDAPGAILLMQQAIEAGSNGRNPESLAWCYSELGDMLFKTGQTAKAKTSFETALRIFPALHRAHAGLGRVLVSEGKLTGAIESYKRAQASVPMVEYAAALEELFESTNKPAEAKKQRQLIDAVDTLSQARGEKANRVLALIYVDENRKLEEAVRLTEAELENRGDVYTYDALSWVYFRTGKLDQAREMSAKALKFQTAEPIFYFHAGVISAGQDPARSEQLLRHALELNPNFDRKHAAEARKRLAQPVAPAAR